MEPGRAPNQCGFRLKNFLSKQETTAIVDVVTRSGQLSGLESEYPTDYRSGRRLLWDTSNTGVADTLWRRLIRSEGG